MFVELTSTGVDSYDLESAWHRLCKYSSVAASNESPMEDLKMKDTGIVIELLIEIEELESKLAPSGAATLGDL